MSTRSRSANNRTQPKPEATSTAIAAPPKPPVTPPVEPKEKTDDFNAMLDKMIGTMPEKPKSTSSVEAEIQDQADKAAADAPIVRSVSKTHGVMPAATYAGPRSQKVFHPKAGTGRISARDTLPRRYLNLIARPEGLDENTGRRVNTNCGPTRGGFGRYTAENTGIAIIYTDAYRVAQLDPAGSGNYVVANDEYREQVYEATGGAPFTEVVVSQLGPDFTKVVPSHTQPKKDLATV